MRAWSSGVLSFSSISFPPRAVCAWPVWSSCAPWARAWTKLHDSSLLSPRGYVIDADALPWFDGNVYIFYFIVIDYPDPTNYALGKLYTTALYLAVSRHLSAQGFLVVQSTSPMFARDSFW